MQPETLEKLHPNAPRVILSARPESGSIVNKAAVVNGVPVQDTSDPFNPFASSSDSPLLPHTDLNVHLLCPDCRNPTPHLVEDISNGDMICYDCGTVVGDRIIDMRSEWRTFQNDSGGANEDPSRVGGPSNPLLEGHGLEGTLISGLDGGTGRSQTLSRTLSKTQGAQAERQLLKSFRDITVLSERYHLPQTIADRAKQLYKFIEDHKLLRGRAAALVQATCIYLACRQEQVPRTYKEICALTKVSKKDLGRCVTTMKPHLEATMQVVSSEDFMARFGSLLDLPMALRQIIAKVTENAERVGCVAGKSPLSIAAAAIWMVTQLKSMQQHYRALKDIAVVVGVSELTIKHAYKDMFPHRHELIPAGVATRAELEALPMQ